MSDTLLDQGKSHFLDAVSEARRLVPEAFATARPTRATIRAIFHGNGDYRLAESSEPVVGTASKLQELCEAGGVAAVPSLAQCAAWHHESGLFVSPPGVNDAGEQQPMTEAHITLCFLMFVFAWLVEDAFDRAGGQPPTDEHFAETYAAIFARWSGTASTGQLVVPVHRLALPSERTSVQVNDKMRLAALTDAEKNAGWYWDLRDFASTNPRDLARCQVALYVDRFRNDSKAANTDDVQLFLTSLRLAAVGGFAAPDAFHHHSVRSVISGGMGPVADFGPLHRWRSTEHRVLTHEEIDDAVATFAHLSALPLDKRRRLDTALSRYRKAFVRDRREDSLVDLVIALESLLLPESRETDLSFRFRTSAVLLLADLAKEERASSLQLFKLLYEARSGIVHRGATVNSYRAKAERLVPGGWDPFYEHAVKLAAQVFKAIIQRLRRGQNMDDVHRDLERRAAGIDA